MQDDHTDPHCDTCDEPLFELSGEWFCPSCDSQSGFELTPDDPDFQL